LQAVAPPEDDEAMEAFAASLIDDVVDKGE
jgi:hypothetical protein